MREVILSADGDSIMYSVPDAVAENLSEYCSKLDDWVIANPKFKSGKELCFNQDDFIYYLNNYVFPDELSRQVRNLGWTNLSENLPKKYKSLPYYNF